MAEDIQKNNEEKKPTRWGKILYDSNPSVSGRFPVTMKPRRLKNGTDAYMVSSSTGEMLGRGSFGFVEEIEVDEAQFIKVYLDGIKQHAQLGKAGVMLFEFVYREMSGAKSKDKDTLTLN